MKITVEHCDTPENEVILRCRELDEEMLHILALLRSGMQSLCAFTEDRETVFLSPQELLYAESVEERTWLYCETAVWRTALSLSELEAQYEATMRNGEKVMISRHYGPLLRERLGML